MLFVLNLLHKGFDEDMHIRKATQRGTSLVQWSCKTAACDTTSELQVGNGLPGAPVTVPMSGDIRRNQGGTVEYFVSHP